MIFTEAEELYMGGIANGGLWIFTNSGDLHPGSIFDRLRDVR